MTGSRPSTPTERFVGWLMAEDAGDWRDFDLDAMLPSTIAVVRDRARGYRLPRWAQAQIKETVS